MAEANIKAVITADDRASHVLNNFGDNVHGVASKIGSVLKIAAEGLAVAGAAVIGFGVVSVKAFSESQDAIAQTNAVLASTKGVAKVTGDEVTKLAAALQKTTKFSDEQVRSAENLLLTFTAIGKDIFPQATKTVLNMATALGEDTKSASIQLGKALQDPVLGITALRRVGVNFSDKQKDVIKALVDTGKSAEAQKLILKELEVEFGGSAEAAGKTFSGALQRLKNNFNDVQEVIGSTIVNYLGPFANKAADAIASIDWQIIIERTIKSIKSFWIELQETWQKIDKVYQQVEHFLKPSLEALWNTVENKLTPALKKLWKDVIEPLAPIIGKAFVAEIWLAINVMNFWIQVTSAVYDALSGLALFIQNDLPKMIDVGINFIKVKFEWLKENGLRIFGEILGFVAVLPIMMPFYMAEAVAGMIKAVISVKWSDVFSGIWQGAQQVWDMVTQTAVNAWHTIHDIAWGALFSHIGKSLANGLIDMIEGALKGALAGLPGNIEKNIHLPRFAKGVNNFSGGLAIVGEQGPELVNLPGGSSVIPNNKIANVAPSGGGTINITLQAGAFMGSDVEARRFAQKILGHLKDAAGSKNMTVGQMIGM